MLRMVCIALALASLGACASVAPPASALTSAAFTSFDADAAPVQNAAAVAIMHLDRRRFSRPTERQPDLRVIFATAYDRARRYPRSKSVRRLKRRV